MKHIYTLTVDNPTDIDNNVLKSTIAAALIDAMRDAPLTIKIQQTENYK